MITEVYRGDVFRMTSYHHLGTDGVSRLGYVTSKGTVAVFLLLGYEKKKQANAEDGALDLEKAMNALGWFKKVEKKR